eukprot:COSAG05_NODE_1067_length_5971_cov_450.254257_13_plen_181_part_00
MRALRVIFKPTRIYVHLRVCSGPPGVSGGTARGRTAASTPCPPGKSGGGGRTAGQQQQPASPKFLRRRPLTASGGSALRKHSPTQALVGSPRRQLQQDGSDGTPRRAGFGPTDNGAGGGKKAHHHHKTEGLDDLVGSLAFLKRTSLKVGPVHHPTRLTATAPARCDPICRSRSFSLFLIL